MSDYTSAELASNDFASKTAAPENCISGENKEYITNPEALIAHLHKEVGDVLQMVQSCRSKFTKAFNLQEDLTSYDQIELLKNCVDDLEISRQNLKVFISLITLSSKFKTLADKNSLLDLKRIK